MSNQISRQIDSNKEIMEKFRVLNTILFAIKQKSANLVAWRFEYWLNVDQLKKSENLKWITPSMESICLIEINKIVAFTPIFDCFDRISIFGLESHE